jgi:hypothetical protein
MSIAPDRPEALISQVEMGAIHQLVVTLGQ